MKIVPFVFLLPPSMLMPAEGRVLLAQEIGKPEKSTEFLRFLDLGNWEGILQCAMATYQNREGASVSLIGAVHDADREHFQRIQERLDSFPVLLFEGWRKPETEDVNDTAMFSAQDLFETLLKISNRFYGLMVSKILGFQHEYEWKAIDFSRPTFVNADMTFSEFSRLCRERSEWFSEFQNGLALASGYWRSISLRLGGLSRKEFGDFINALSADPRQVGRYLFARESAFISNLYAEILASEGACQTVTIHRRNDLIFETLQQKMTLGHGRIGLYYGAAHMPELENRLLRLGFHKVDLLWIEAWNLLRDKR